MIDREKSHLKKVIINGEVVWEYIEVEVDQGICGYSFKSAHDAMNSKAVSNY